MQIPARTRGGRTLAERGLIADSGRLTIAGALVLTDPERSLKAAKFCIDVRGYDTATATSYIRRETIAGPAQEQVARATELVIRDIGTESIVTGAYRHDVPRLPLRAVREVIANAVAHRSYEVDTAPVVVEIRPASVVVTSPGPLPPPVTIESLRVAQAPRNHTLIAILRRFRLAEDSGQGIDVIQDQMRLELRSEPRFAEVDDSFRVELPLQGLITPTERAWLAEFERTGRLDGADRAVLLRIVRDGRVTNSGVREVVGMDSTAARASLHRDSGLAIQHGSRGRAYYTLGTIGPRASDREVVLAAAASGPLTNHKVRELTGLERIDALALLKQLVEEGQLRQHGQRRGTTYVLRPRGRRKS